jgi:hypothetical protein
MCDKAHSKECSVCFDTHNTTQFQTLHDGIHEVCNTCAEKLRTYGTTACPYCRASINDDIAEEKREAQARAHYGMGDGGDVGEGLEVFRFRFSIIDGNGNPVYFSAEFSAENELINARILE